MGKIKDDPNRISSKEAAHILRMSLDTFYQTMQQDKMPKDVDSIGFAVKKAGATNWTYTLYRNKVEALARHWGFYD